MGRRSLVPGGTVNSSSTVSSGDYYMASYELPCNANIVSTPTFNTGCVFSMWTDLNEKTGVSTNCKVTSDYVNDKTYAYERSMPAYNMTLTLPECWMKLFIPFITGNRKQPELHLTMTIKTMNLPKQRRKSTDRKQRLLLQ